MIAPDTQSWVGPSEPGASSWQTLMVRTSYMLMNMVL